MIHRLPLIVVCLLAATLVLSPRASAQDRLADYQLSTTDWNGLSSLQLVAEDLGISMESRSSIDLADHPVEQPILVLYPTSAPNAEALARHVDGGGRLVVADDFGAAEPVLDAFNLQRTEMPREHGAFLMSNPALPRLAPVGAHPLSDGIRDVVANHPSGLRGAGLPVIAYEDGTGLVYDMTLGEGRAVFVADASMFINLMVPIRDNAALLRNMLRYVCADVESCTVVVVTGDAPIVESEDADGSGSVGLSGSLADLNDHLHDLADVELDDSATYFASVLLMAGTLIVLLTIFPLKRPSWIGLSFRPRRPPPQSEFEFNLNRWRGQHGERSYGMPAALLRSQFERLFYQGMELKRPASDSASRRERRKVAEAYVRRYEKALAGGARGRRVREVARLLNDLAALPAAEVLLWNDERRVDANTLRRFQRETQAILKAMDLDDEYRVRTQRPR